MKKQPALNVERLNSLLDARGWGPMELVERAELTYDALYKLRTHDGAVMPRADTLARIALALGCSMEYLLGLSDTPTPVAVDMTETTRRLLDIANRLSVPRQRDLVLIAQTLQAADETTQGVTELLLSKIENMGGQDALHDALTMLEGSLPDTRRRRRRG